jgi:hypothetical protein
VNTARGCAKAPTKFLAQGMFTATLPPIAASSWASSVVGTLT